MQTIFLQVKTEMGHAYDTARKLVEIEGVSEVYSTSGHYDLMVKCHLASGVDIGHFVTEQMQKVPGVQDTFTIITFNAFS